MPQSGDGSIPEYARGYQSFGGTVGRTSSQSEPWWPEEEPAPSPNIVVVLVDDLGYSDIGPFGAEIPTPNIDRIAATGYRLSNYHTTPVCSPARAALLTGLNPHRAGYGSVANSDPGFPGLRLELADDVLTLPEILRESGYATFAVGKWHLVRDADMSPGRSRKSWPLQRGFDSYYGSLEGLNSFFHPNQLVADNSVVDVDEYPQGYYVTDDLTDQAIGRIKALRAHDAEKPFFLYFAHIAMHGPHQVKPEDLARHRGKYSHGWDEVRRRRFAEQVAAGLFDPGTPIAERNTEPGYDAPPWDSLDEEEKRRYQRYQEVYAALVDSVDQSVGRVIDLLEELGELDDTILVFTSDNGGTAEGGPVGTRSYFSQFVHGPVPPDWERDIAHDEELIGSAELGVHYPRGWGQASNTPFRFYKGQTFAGGVRVPFLLSWPGGVRRDGGDNGVRREFSYVTDLAPTLLDLAGISTPATRHGVPAAERDGVSIAQVLRDRAAESPHTEQYAEFGGHRGFYRDGWKLLSLHDQQPAHVDTPQWELYDTRVDPAETQNVADRHPELVAELAAAWDEAAWRNTVFPLFDTPGAAQRRRPAEERRFGSAVRILAGTPTMERYRSSRLVAYRDFEAIVELDGWRPSDEGVLIAHGDLQGGYLLAVEDGRLHFVYNAYGRVDRVCGVLPSEPSEITLSARATPQLRWTFEVRARAGSGAEYDTIAELRDAVQLVGMAPWTGISVGLDARGPVDGDLRRRRGVFRAPGSLVAVTYRPGEIRVPDRVRRELNAHAADIAD